MNFLHSMVPNNFCSKIVILFICYYKGNTRLNYIKPRLTLLIRDFLKFQAVSCQFDFKSCFLIYADLYFCDLRPHARTTGEHEWHIFQRHKVFQPNAHAQFPWKIPYLIISEHYWFSISRTFLLQVCHYPATFNYTPKCYVTQLSSNPWLNY